MVAIKKGHGAARYHAADTVAKDVVAVKRGHAATKLSSS
jgi:hypothetical protein